MFSDNDRKLLTDVRSILGGAVAQGQTSFIGSIKAIAGDNQANQQLLREIKGLLTRLAKKAGA